MQYLGTKPQVKENLGFDIMHTGIEINKLYPSCKPMHPSRDGWFLLMFYDPCKNIDDTICIQK